MIMLLYFFKADQEVWLKKKKNKTKGLQGIKQREWNDLLLCLFVPNQFPTQEPDSDSTSRDSIST